MLIKRDLDDETIKLLLPLIEQSSAYDEVDLKTAKEKHARVFLLFEDEKLAGCIIYRLGKRMDFDKENHTDLSDNTLVLYLDLLQVDDDFRFKGYGRLLWEAVREEFSHMPIIFISTVFSTDFWHRFAQIKENNWFLSFPGEN